MPIFLTEKQLCECLSLTRPFLYNCRQLGMPFVPVGVKGIRYNLDDVLEWMNRRYGKVDTANEKGRSAS